MIFGFAKHHEHRRHRITLTPEVAQGDGGFLRDVRQDGDNRGVSGQPARRFGQEFWELETVGRFESGQGCQDLLQLGRSPPGFNEDGLEAVRGGPFGGLGAGHRPGAELLMPALVLGTLGRIPPVGDEPNLLPHLIDRVGQRGGGHHRQFLPVNRVLGAEAGGVQVQHNRGPGDAGRLIDLALQRAGAGGGAPVDAIEGIPPFERAHPGNARGVLEQSV